jgi:hypothetical protein
MSGTCNNCQAALPEEHGRFCPSCGFALAAVPRANPALRTALLDCYLTRATSTELTAWLQQLGQDPRGKLEEKIERVRQNTKYLTMPAEDFPEQTAFYLGAYNAGHLADICADLGLPDDGPKNTLFRRIYRHVGILEGWLPQQPTVDLHTVLAFTRWYPLRPPLQSERDAYVDFEDEMIEVFGEDLVHPQYTVAHGNALKIDFHIGQPRGAGVGVEFKMPRSNSDIQKAMGQLDQYLTAYPDGNLIMVLIDDGLPAAMRIPFEDTLRKRGVTTVVKSRA